MKGVIFNLAEEVVTEAFSADVWDDILEKSGLGGSYTSLGSYPDGDLFRLVGAAAEQLDVPADDVVRLLGTGAIPLLAQRFPAFFEHPSTVPFLLTLNDIIHPEVLKLYPEADLPRFDFEAHGSTRLVLGYRSHRKLCALAEGFIIGASRHFGESATISQPQCMNDGADQCVLDCSFAPA